MNDEQLSDHQIATIRQSLVDTAKTLKGIPYQIAVTQADRDAMVGKWTDLSKPPATLDCSGLVAGTFQKCGLKMPHGSQAQFDFTLSTAYPQDGDLGFFGHDKDIFKIYHVGIVYGGFVIEARATDKKASFPTGMVILRPMEKWSNWSNFCGWRVHPKLVQIKAV